jgi:hypothetical protein
MPTTTRATGKYGRCAKRYAAEALGSLAMEPLPPGELVSPSTEAVQGLPLDEIGAELAGVNENLKLLRQQSFPSSKNEACGAWMPTARARCVLPARHDGHHRSRL